MPLLHIVILALVQGITEFLPISSSGHLVLTHAWLGLTPDDMTLDIAVHVGTLLAVLVYFRADIVGMICAVKPGEGDPRMLRNVVIASIPVVIAGYLLHLTGPEWTRSLHLLAWCTLIFGILLWAADKFRPDQKSLASLTVKDALLVGLAQVLALIPGVSRSGITMSTGRALGFSRTESARFSLLLATIAISGAGTLGVIDLIESGNTALGADAVIAAILSFLSSWGVIIVMMRWLQKADFTPFVIYRILLGLLLLGLLYTGNL